MKSTHFGQRLPSRWRPLQSSSAHFACSSQYPVVVVGSSHLASMHLSWKPISVCERTAAFDLRVRQNCDVLPCSKTLLHVLQNPDE